MDVQLLDEAVHVLATSAHKNYKKSKQKFTSVEDWKERSLSCLTGFPMNLRALVMEIFWQGFNSCSSSKSKSFSKQVTIYSIL